MAKYLLFDIGGTSIKTATYENELSKIKEIPTEAQLGSEQLIDKICNEIARNKDVVAVGISSAGQVNSTEGYIIHANENLPGYTGTNWAKIIKDKFNLPVYVENDVNAAALGEANCGSGIGHKDFLCLTYGTGVGGAIILDGKVFHGASGSAGEFGAMMMNYQNHDDEQPFSGGYEKYASTTNLVECVQRVRSDISNGKEVFDHLDDEKVVKELDEWCRRIALGLMSLIHVFNPSLIILGGGVMEQDLIFNKVNEYTKKLIMPSYACVKLQQASLGNKAGLYGALSLILTKTE